MEEVAAASVANCSTSTIDETSLANPPPLHVHGDINSSEAVAAATDGAAENSRIDDTGAGANVDDDSAQRDDFLDVIVTGADVLDSSSMHTSTSISAGVVASASSLLLGAQDEYVVELVVSTDAGSYCRRRRLSELLAVLQLAASAATNPRELLSTVGLPSFPTTAKKQSQNDALIAQWCGDMTHFLANQASVLRDVPQWLTFVEEPTHGAGSRAHMTAIAFILQPFAFEKIYVPRGSRHEVVVNVKHPSQFLVWKFELDEHDVDFSITFDVDPHWLERQQPMTNTNSNSNGATSRTTHAVHARTRYHATTTTGRPIEGMYKCPGDGRATLVWDNSYSRLRGKNILFQVEAISSAIMTSAATAADALYDALKAKRQARDQALAASLATAIIPSPLSSTTAASELSTAARVAALLPETLLQPPTWLVHTSVSVANRFASRLFGSQAEALASDSNKSDGRVDDDALPSDRKPRDAAHAKSLLEELNGLNMQLLERLEHLEDKVVKLTVERDQERSKTHVALVEKENTNALVQLKTLEVDGLRSELLRMQREREAWREIQSERDALLEEKHRWAMSDDFADDNCRSNARMIDMDSDVRVQLEHELGQAEASVLRLRAELGYALSNHLTGTSTRLEKIAREMTSAKKQYEDQLKANDHDVVQLKHELLKYRCQKRVLVTELRNLKSQTDGQVAVAIAEASEARMVNRRLKKQNALLLTQIRTLVDDAQDVAKTQAREQQRSQETSAEAACESVATLSQSPPSKQSKTESINAPSSLRLQPTTSSSSYNSADVEEEEDAEGVQSSVPYTLSASDIALLNGETKPHAATERETYEEQQDQYQYQYQQYQQQQTPPPSLTFESLPSSPHEQRTHSTIDPLHRARLVSFFEVNDPSLLPEVDAMLANYDGVEALLFESLELKYSFMALNAQIAQLDEEFETIG